MLKMAKIETFGLTGLKELKMAKTKLLEVMFDREILETGSYVFSYKLDLFVFFCFKVTLIFFSFLQLFPLKWRLVLQHASVLHKVELQLDK